MAEANRALPAGGIVADDYAFRTVGTDGEPTDLRLSELFGPGIDSVAIYSYMFSRHPEDENGASVPMLNVFHRDADGTIRHHWGSELYFAPTDGDQDPRHTGALEPLWNLFDLVPDGRPQDWDEQLSYEPTAASRSRET